MTITADILRCTDRHTGKPLLRMVSDEAGQKGTGRWCATAAWEIETAVPTISGAVEARILSGEREQRQRRAKTLEQLKEGLEDTEGPLAVRRDPELGDEQLRAALLGGMIISYAQGFALLAKYRTPGDAALPLRTIAELWQGGCIIRSELLKDIATAFSEQSELSNLLYHGDIASGTVKTIGSLRQVVGQAIANGLPVPALAGALAYYDSWHSPELGTRLIQARA